MTAMGIKTRTVTSSSSTAVQTNNMSTLSLPIYRTTMAIMVRFWWCTGYEVLVLSTLIDKNDSS